MSAGSWDATFLRVLMSILFLLILDQLFRGLSPPHIYSTLPRTFLHKMYKINYLFFRVSFSSPNLLRPIYASDLRVPFVSTLRCVVLYADLIAAFLPSAIRPRGRGNLNTLRLEIPKVPFSVSQKLTRGRAKWRLGEDSVHSPQSNHTGSRGHVQEKSVKKSALEAQIVLYVLG